MSITPRGEGIDGPAKYRVLLGNNEVVALLGARLLSGIGDQLRAWCWRCTSSIELMGMPC